MFYFLAALVLVSAVLVVALRHTVHSALALGLCLAGVGGLFALLGADFLFAAQIMIYVGGIAVLILFAVMLLGRASDLHLRQVNHQWLGALLLSGVCFLGLWRVARMASRFTASMPAGPTTQGLGVLMMGDYSVPFELVSLVLTAGLLGAIFFSRVSRTEEKKQ